MPVQIYRSHFVVTFARFDHRGEFWVPKADIRWRAGNRYRSELLTGPENRFKAKPDADRFAFEMAKAWIDSRFREAS
jgi:hypothetical protein